MINLFIVLYLSFAHWLADFVLQTDQQAKNKSKDNIALLSHTATYTAIMFVAMQILQTYNYFGAQFWYASILFTFIQFFSHTLIDYITSRINSNLWSKGDVHNFFVSIGFDQFMHIAILFISFNLIYGS